METEYQCVLLRNQKPQGKPFPNRIDFSSLKSKVEALQYAMRLYHRPERDIEQYLLEVYDDDGNFIRHVHVTTPELERHKAGPPDNGADGSLADASDDQLIAELRRRLPGR